MGDTFLLYGKKVFKEVYQRGEGAHRPSPWNHHTPILAPEDGAESKYFDKSTPAVSVRPAGVTRRFGRNPALGCSPDGYAAHCLTGGRLQPNSRMAKDHLPSCRPAGPPSGKIQPQVATKGVVNAPASGPARVRGYCKPRTSRAIRPPTAAALYRSGFSLLARFFGPFLSRDKKGHPQISRVEDTIDPTKHSQSQSNFIHNLFHVLPLYWAASIWYNKF